MKINAFIEYFKNYSTFDVKDVQKYFNKRDPNLNSSTVNWRIYELVKNNIIDRIGRGKYTLNIKKSFIPYITNEMIELYNDLKRNFPYLDICLWSSLCLNEFMIHQPINEFYFVEAEADSLLSLLYYIRDVKDDQFKVVLEADFEIFERYYPINYPTVILKKLVTESPVITYNNIVTASLEKILVDLFFDTKLLEAYQGKELYTIYNTAMSKYSINSNRMFRYANRRGNKDKIINYLKTNQINGSK